MFTMFMESCNQSVVELNLKIFNVIESASSR